MSFKTDIFISYAQLDNQSPDPEKDGWISRFHYALERMVAPRLGKDDLKVFRDVELINSPLEVILEKLRDSAVLVSILSPRYARSEWCDKELKQFCHLGDDPEALRVGDKLRLIKVVKLPPKDAEPPETRDILGFEFYTIDPTTRTEHELDPTLVPECKGLYWSRLEDLAQTVTEVLTGLNEEGQKRELKEAVYLAETGSDLAERRDEIKRELERHGYKVLPDRSLPFDAVEVRKVVEEQLTRTRLSVHLIGASGGWSPEGGPSIVSLQNDLAAAVDANELYRLVWIPPGLEIEDENQSELVERLRTDPAALLSGDLLETGIDELKAVIRRRLERPEHEMTKAPNIEGPRREGWIYLMCDQRDRKAARFWERCLLERGHQVELPVFEGDPDKVRTGHEDNLRLCDAVLIFFEAAHPLWLRRMLGELKRCPAYGRATPLLAVALAVGPAADLDRASVSNGPPLLQLPEVPDCAALEPFFEQLERALEKGQ